MTTLLNTAAENRVDLEFALGSSDFVLPAELEASEPPDAGWPETKCVCWLQRAREKPSTQFSASCPIFCRPATCW